MTQPASRVRLERFATVGVINTLCDGILFFVLVCLTGLIVISNVLSYLAGAVVSFLLNKHWTFANVSRGGATRSQIVKFAILSGVSLTVSTITVSGFAEILPLLFAKLISVIVTTGISFLGMRYFVF